MSHSGDLKETTNEKQKPLPKPSKPISYELFAPRSNEQRSRLLQIQRLTDHLLEIPNSVTPIADDEIHENGTNDSHSIFNLRQAMSPEVQVHHQAFLSQGTSSINDDLSKGTFIYPKFESSEEKDDEILHQALNHARNTSSQIVKIMETSSNLHNALIQTTHLAKQIQDRYESLLTHSSELSKAAERLQTESDQLTEHAQEIGLPLKHYDAVDRLGLQVGVLFKNGAVVNGIAKVKVDDEEMIQVLDDIDSAIRFFAERSALSSPQHHSQHGGKNKSSAISGSIEYYNRSLTLQTAALDLFKDAVVLRLTQTAMQISSALDLNRKPVSGDLLVASLIYTRFYGISSRTRKLLHIIQARMGTIVVPTKKSGEYVCPYTELWTLCRNTYIQVRESLLKLSVRSHLDFLKDKHGLIGMTRLASVFLMRLCTAETSLYLDFFGKEEDKASHESGSTDQVEDSVQISKLKKDSFAASQVMSKDGAYYDVDFQGLLDTLCNNVHRTIRSGMVSVLDLDTLCQIVSVLREERGLANASPTTMAAARSLGNVIVDAQERLIFCANTVLSKDVTRFKPTPADLDYPDKLRRHLEQNDEKKEGGEDDVLKRQMRIYESWFPPIRSVLKVLSRIFKVVEPKVFEDIALSSIQSCCKSLKEGSGYIKKKSGTLHSDLFLVKHLLILREQLSPFDIQLQSVERQLDFSDAGKAVSKFLATRNRRLFSLSTENALLTLLREGVHTTESSVDSKRDLEDALRSACNDFIEHTTESLAGPIITFVEQCKSIEATKSPFITQSFTTAEHVKSMLSLTFDRMEPQLGEVKSQMMIYMESEATRSILFKPVVRKIVRLLDESKRFLHECAVRENVSWKDGDKDHAMKILQEIDTVIKT